MGARGRSSAAALSVVGPAGIVTVRRPEPPSDLDADTAAEWRAVVNQLPADWFPRETHAILAQYCKHVVAGRDVSNMITKLKEKADAIPDDENPLAMMRIVKSLDKLYKMQEREGRAISSLATKMRLTNQSRYDPKKVHKKSTAAAEVPWSDDE